MSAQGKTPEQRGGMIHRHHRTMIAGDGVAVEFDIGGTVLRDSDLLVFVAGLLQRPQENATANDYALRGISAGYDGDSNRIKFVAAPGAGARIDILRIGG